MKWVVRSVIFMHYNLTDFVLLNSKREVNFQVWVAQDNMKVVDTCLKHSEMTNQDWKHILYYA